MRVAHRRSFGRRSRLPRILAVFAGIGLVAGWIALGTRASAMVDAAPFSFADSRDLTVTLANGSMPQTIEIGVIVQVPLSASSAASNGSSSGNKGKLHLDLIHFTSGNILPSPAPSVSRPPGDLPDSVLPAPLPLTKTVGTDPLVTFRFALTPPKQVAGTFTGRVVVYDQAGNLISKGLTIVLVPAAPSRTSTSSSGTVFPQYVDTVTFRVTRGLWDWPWDRDDITLTRTLPPDLSGARTIIGAADGPRSSSAQVVRDGDMLEITGLSESGEYSGKIDLLPQSDAGQAMLEINIRDGWLLTLLAILLGLLIAEGLDRYIREWRPRRVLQERLSSLRETTVKAQAAGYESAQIPTAPYPVPHYRIYDEATTTGLFHEAATSILTSFKDAGSESERKAFLPGGTEYQKLQGYCDAIPKLFLLGRALAKDLLILKGLADQADPGTFDRIEAVKQARSALSDRRALVRTSDELDRLQKELGDASAFLADLRSIYESAVEVENQAHEQSNSQVEQRAAALRSRLRAARTRDALPTFRGRVEQLQQELGAAGALAIPTMMLATVQPGEGSVKVVVNEVTRGEQILINQDPILVASKNLRKQISRQDVIYSIIAGVVVLVSGMSAIYVANATFGSAADYIGALLWGAGVGEGIKIARRILPSIVGRLSGTSS